MIRSPFRKKQWLLRPVILLLIWLLVEAQANPEREKPSILSPLRTDIVSVTPWQAPIVWERTFDPVLLDAMYESRPPTIAVTVFAVGKYTRFLRDFLETAERHFFARGAAKVTLYVFTDRPSEVPSVVMGAGRELVVKTVPAMNRWQEITAGRMKYIQDLIETELQGHADYIFCFDVDDKFHGRWGTETLGKLVAALHPWFYTEERGRFTYERSPASTAYMGPNEGDFYYGGAFFGGELPFVHRLVSTCRHNFDLDAVMGIEAEWQEESHVNKYLWINKPSKVLSPEYLWSDFHSGRPSEIRVIRFSSVIKDYAEIRPN